MILSSRWLVDGGGVAWWKEESALMLPGPTFFSHFGHEILVSLLKSFGEAHLSQDQDVVFEFLFNDMCRKY